MRSRATAADAQKRVPPEDVRFVDLMGNRRAAPAADADGTIAIPLTPAPLFVVSRDAEGLLKAFGGVK